MGTQFETSATLLGRLRHQPADETAWQEFVQRYVALIRQWCRRWGLTAADTEDVIQNVLLRLARQMNDFEYDAAGSFRGWLKTVTYRVWCDYLKQRERRKDAGSGDTTVLQVLKSQEARDDFTRQIEDEWQRELLERAMWLVRQRVEPHTWEAFRLMTQHGLTGEQTAERLQMKVGAVFVAGSKIRRMLREEIGRLSTG